MTQSEQEKTRQGDTLLALRLGRREVAAYEEFYTRYASYLRNLAIRWLSVEDAEEVVNDVLLQAIKDIDEFDSRISRMSTWLLARTRNRAIDRARQNARRTRLVVGDSLDLADLVAIPGPEQSTEVRAEFQRYWGALNSTEREIVILHYWYGLSYAEVGARLKMSANTAIEHARRGRDKVRRIR